MFFGEHLRFSLIKVSNCATFCLSLHRQRFRCRATLARIKTEFGVNPKQYLLL